MRASEIMTSPVVSVPAHTPVHDAATLLAEHGFASLPVVDDDGRVIGIVSEIDVVRDRMPRDPRTHMRPSGGAGGPDPAHTVREVMTDSVACVGGGADAADVAALMVEIGVRAVPVVDGGRLVGIISRRDLLRSLLRPDADIAQEIAQRLDDFSAETGRWRVRVEDGVVRVSGRFDDEAQREIVVALARTVPGALRVHIARR